MGIFDWVVLIGTLGFIVLYGTWKTRKSKNLDGYLKGGNDMNWSTIGLSVMATQASAITFISTPGQAYESGLGFIQNYFGLPLALIIVSAVFIPIYYKLKVFTAYEYLETRFGIQSRLLAAFLFLVQRGLAAGITIYAPAIILSTALGWNLNVTILMVGILVIIYTVSGGTKAVSLTQKWQMGVIMTGMFTAFFLIIYNLPQDVTFFNAIGLAGKMGKLDAVNFSFDIKERYTFWSGITGGMFLALSYFGTDQSQVQRYLGGKSVYESRLGLMFNALLKVPMQFFILMVGVMVYIFFSFQEHPILFNQAAINTVHESSKADEMQTLENEFSHVYQQKRLALTTAIAKHEAGDEAGSNTAIKAAKEKEIRSKELRASARELVIDVNPKNDSKDSDYVFLSFIMNYMPTGLIGLLLAVIFSAAMSSTAGELNALSATTTIDFYKRLIKKEGSEKHYLIASKVLTMLWGVVAIGFALFARLVENLIEAVNILGSIFYGTILGIFLIAFFVPIIKGKAAFYGAILGELIVISLYLFYTDEIGYLWYNVVGCAATMGFALLISPFEKKTTVA